MVDAGGNARPGSSAFPPLVSRERELLDLRRALQQALDGGGGLVLISGEAGIGKTTLVQTFAREAVGQDALILQGYCFDLSTTPPYGLWLELTDRYPEHGDLPLVPDALRRATGVGDLPHQMALFEVARDFLHAAARQRPLVVLLEDVHWADQASLDLLRYLARHLDSQRILLIATYRDDEVTREHPLFSLLPSLVRESQAIRIALNAFDRDAVSALVTERWILPDTDQNRLVAYLFEHAEGHPLFTIELLRTLEQGSYVRQSGDGWHLTDLRGVPVPSLVRQVIERRVAQLEDEARHFLEVAAVIGHQVPLDIWQAVARMADEDVLALLDQATNLHLLEEVSEWGTVQFVHALVREALYTRIVIPRRRLWHRLAAEILADAASPLPDTVAYHFQQAADPRAIEWLIRAGVRARGAAAWVTAAERFVDAATLLEGTADGERTRGWLLFYSAFILRFSQSPKVSAYWTEAQRIAEATNDRVLTAYIKYHGGGSAALRGDVQRGLEDIEQGVRAIADCFDQTDPPPTEEIALGIIRAHLPEFATTGEESAVGTMAVLDRPPVVTQRGVLVNWLGHAGRYRESFSMGQPFVVEMAEALKDDHGRWMRSLPGNIGLAHSYAALGCPDAARREYHFVRQGYLTTDDYSMVEYSCWCDLYHVVLPYYTDRVGERERLLLDAQHAWSRASGIISFATPVSQTELEIEFLHGRWAEAREHASGQCSSPLASMADRAHVILGIIARYQGSPAQAWEHVREVIPRGPATEPGDCYFSVHVGAQTLAIQLALDAADLDSARSWLKSHDHWLSWSGSVRWQAENRLLWARYYAMTGDTSAARQHAEESERLANEPRQPLTLIAVHRFLGELAIQAHDISAANQHLKRSIDLAEACAIPIERALTTLSLAELELTRGKKAAARALLAEVRRICSELDARPTLERVEALTARLRPKEIASRFGLSPREHEVLALLVQGNTDKQIAEQLFISHHTVSRHVSHILTKLAVDSRTAATAEAVRYELV
jgi:DNA-binding CsgD family transcriptional regulator